MAKCSWFNADIIKAMEKKMSSRKKGKRRKTRENGENHTIKKKETIRKAKIDFYKSKRWHRYWL